MEGKNIIRVQKNKDYTVINNTSIRDDRLSWKAKAIHVFMLSKPDDWTFHNEEIAKWAKDGIDSFNSGLKELKKYGYVKKERRKGEGGKFDWVTVVYEVPQIEEPYPEKPPMDNEPYPDLPCMENPSMEKPFVEKPSMENPRLLSTDTQNTDLLSTDNNQVLTTTNDGQSLLSDERLSKLVKFYDENIQRMTGYIHECIIHMLNENNPELVEEAFKIAAKSQPRVPLNYIEGTLEKWRNKSINNLEDLKAKESRERNAKGNANSKRSDENNGYSPDLGF